MIYEEPDFIYCLFAENGPPMKDVLPIFHDIGDVFYIGGIKYKVFEIGIADGHEFEEIGLIINSELTSYIIYAEEIGSINFKEYTRNLKLKNIIRDDEH